jgi:hypothetical protein
LEQLFHQLIHGLRFDLNAAEEVGRCGRIRNSAVLERFDKQIDRCNGRPQLVRYVGHEVAANCLEVTQSRDVIDGHEHGVDHTFGADDGHDIEPQNPVGAWKKRFMRNGSAIVDGVADGEADLYVADNIPDQPRQGALISEHVPAGLIDPQHVAPAAKEQDPAVVAGGVLLEYPLKVGRLGRDPAQLKDATAVRPSSDVGGARLDSRRF